MNEIIKNLKKVLTEAVETTDYQSLLFSGGLDTSILVAINSNFLDKKWLGFKINNDFIKKLKIIKHIDINGENGEYHTFVYDGPTFKKPVKFNLGKKLFQNNHWLLEVKT